MAPDHSRRLKIAAGVPFLALAVGLSAQNDHPVPSHHARNRPVSHSATTSSAAGRPSAGSLDTGTSRACGLRRP